MNFTFLNLPVSEGEDFKQGHCLLSLLVCPDILNDCFGFPVLRNDKRLPGMPMLRTISAAWVFK